VSKALENAIPRQIARESQFLWLWKRTINYVYQCYTNKSRTDGYFFTNRARHEFSDSYSGQPSTEKPAQLLARLPGPARAPLCDRATSGSPSKLAALTAGSDGSQLGLNLSKASENGIPRQIERDSHFVWLAASPICTAKQYFNGHARSDRHFFANRANRKFSDNNSG
jgi:hypothetical protein